MLLRAPAQGSPARLAPVPLPDPALPDAAYKTALSDLLTDPARRPGVYVALAGEISRDTIPPHAAVIVELLSAYLGTGNPLESVVPLKVIGRCGAAARPALSKVLTLAASPIAPVRLAVTEALGGMYDAPPGTAPTCPPSVITVLVHTLETDEDRGTKRAAAVALGRCRVATSEVTVPLAAVLGGTDVPVALGALSAAQAFGPSAKILIPAIRTRLADAKSVANAAPALLSVAAPQEAVDALAQTMAATNSFVVSRSPCRVAYIKGVFAPPIGPREPRGGKPPQLTPTPWEALTFSGRLHAGSPGKVIGRNYG